MTDETPWFEVDRDKPDDVARRVVDTVRDIERRQWSIHEGHRRHARMYSGYLPSGMTWQAGASGYVRQPFAATKAVVRGVVDTATALISKFRPKSTILTFGGDWEQQRQAMDLDRFLAGAYSESGLYPAASLSFRDSCEFGTGLWKYVPEGEGEKFVVKVNRVLPDNFVVDEDECPEEPFDPANTYHRTKVSVEALVRKYAKGDKALEWKIRSSSTPEWPNRSVPTGWTILVEAVHAGPGGRRVLCVPGVVLEDSDWEFPWHPYTFLWWHLPTSGFYGDGVAYRQYGLQERVSYMYRWIEKVHNLFGTPTAWVDPAGGPPVLQMSNEIGAIVQTRRPPTFQPRQMIAAEVYNWIDRLVAGGFEDEGINMATAGNQLPPGVESAPAQREYNFKESNRFAPVSQRWEDAIAVEAARKMTALYADHYKRSGVRPKVRWADRKMAALIEWPDLDIDSYVIRPAASSLDTLAPHARIQAAIELSQTNWLSPGEGRRLMGHPDLEASDDLDNAPRDYALMVLRDLWHGEFVEVDRLANLQVLDEVVRKGRLLARQRKAPPEIIDNLSDFLERLDTVSQAAAAAHAQAAMAAQPPVQPGQDQMGPLSEASAVGSPSPFPAGA